MRIQIFGIDTFQSYKSKNPPSADGGINKDSCCNYYIYLIIYIHILLLADLPSCLEYVPESTKVYGVEYPDGIEYQDGITNGGICIDGFTTNEVCYITFITKVVDYAETGDYKMKCNIWGNDIFLKMPKAELIIY